jgi:transposase
MASRYDANTNPRAVQLVREHAGDYETEWAAMWTQPLARLGRSAVARFGGSFEVPPAGNGR